MIYDYFDWPKGVMVMVLVLVSRVMMENLDFFLPLIWMLLRVIMH